MPRYEDLDWRGLSFTKEQFAQATSTTRDEWIAELASHDELFFKLFNRLPREFPSIRDLLLAGLWRTPRVRSNRGSRPKRLCELMLQVAGVRGSPSPQIVARSGLAHFVKSSSAGIESQAMSAFSVAGPLACNQLFTCSPMSSP